MTIILTYLDGSTATVEHVRGVRIVERHVVELETFGNGPAINRDIASFSGGLFSFDWKEA